MDRSAEHILPMTWMPFMVSSTGLFGAPPPRPGIAPIGKPWPRLIWGHEQQPYCAQPAVSNEKSRRAHLKNTRHYINPRCSAFYFNCISGVTRANHSQSSSKNSTLKDRLWRILIIWELRKCKPTGEYRDQKTTSLGMLWLDNDLCVLGAVLIQTCAGLS